MKRLLPIISLGFLCLQSHAQGFFTWVAEEGDFYTASNWDRNGLPGAGDVVIINNDGRAVIAADAGDRALSSFELGEFQDSTDSGHIVMNGGFFSNW